MRFAGILIAGLTLTLAACESSNKQYGLSGDVNQDQRAIDYSNSNNNGSHMDSDRAQDTDKSMDDKDK